jgi:Mor family transcriptional regulator
LTEELTRVLRQHLRPGVSAEHLAAAVAHHFGGQQLFFPSGQGGRLRRRTTNLTAVYRHRHGKLIRDLARQYGISTVGVYKVLRAKLPLPLPPPLRRAPRRAVAPEQLPLPGITVV